MNEAETRAEYIDPILKAAGWGVVEGSIIRREYKITLGPLQGLQRRGSPLVADYVLIYRNRILGVIEAKSAEKPLTEGLAQGKHYGEKLSTPFAYSSNGIDGFYEVDMITGEEKPISSFPSPDELWNKTFREIGEQEKGFNAIALEPKTRYYQEIAINRVMETIAKDQKRILLTLATGTGKTFIASQIVWKLYKSRWNLSKESNHLPRILFLADRNILADQAYNAFSCFPEDALIRIAPEEIKKREGVPKNGSLFFTIFQTFMSGPNDFPYFGDYPQDFFDCIIVDECHRGGASDESQWRSILDYFSPAVQLGLTATPKRKNNVDTYRYFGEPVYTYSLKEGINDGFLTPFKVKQFATTIDEYVYAPDDDIVDGEVEKNKIYKESDHNRIIEIKEREAYRVQLFMDEMNSDEKTLVFCASQEHALLVRDLINQYKNHANPNYCHRVTANDKNLGEQHLREFQDSEKTIPTILTTSKKLSTGVDARNVRNIVLLRPIHDMIEFKQIIGRGTRLYDEKDFFTIYDFVKAYHHFHDEEWDGPPKEEAPCSKCLCNPCECDEKCSKPSKKPPYFDQSQKSSCRCEKKKKVTIKLADHKVRAFQSMVSTTYYHPDGKPMASQEFIQCLFKKLPTFFTSEEALEKIWSNIETRKNLLDTLEKEGFGKEQLLEISHIIDADKSDLFDVLRYIAYATPVLTRKERAAQAKKIIPNYFDPQEQVFLNFALDEYVKIGIEQLDKDNLFPLIRLKYHSIEDASSHLRKHPDQLKNAFHQFQQYLYQSQHPTMQHG
ncbi:MAG: DEAD/DEAH box helicase family protein [Candidatus Neptunochlamydia sp.]|nr:DEAD/DEAH box helicase family protein [Candidatus Neptunochlamydia sp.]